MSAKAQYVFGVEPSTECGYIEAMFSSEESAMHWILTHQTEGEWWVTKWTLSDPESGHIVLVIRFRSQAAEPRKAEVRRLGTPYKPGTSMMVDAVPKKPRQKQAA